jgi:hypothetical protein
MPASNIYDAIASVPWAEVGTWTVASIGTFVVTGIAAFVGVDRAFKREREKRAEDIVEARAAEIRRALFALLRAHGYLLALDEDFCKPIRENPPVKFFMKPFLGMGDRWALNLDSLHFLLSTRYREVSSRRTRARKTFS